MEKLFLIDISSFIFRAFFAVKHLTTTKGTPVNAVYGVTTMLLNLLEKHQPDQVICIFDTPKPSFRKEIYAEYKSNRGAPPDDLIPQFELIERAVDAIGIKALRAPGFEADDLIATMARKIKDREIIIVTGDKDLMQLVDDRVKVLDTMKNQLYGPEDVKAKMGVGPEYITDLLGLTGDSSDNIPGVEGIGPKTASELIAQYGHLEDILKAIPKMKEGKRRDSLDSSRKIALLSKELATVRDDLVEETKGIKIKDLNTKAPGGEAFRSFLSDMEFKSLLKKYFGDEAEVVKPARPSLDGGLLDAVKKADARKAVKNAKDWAALQTALAKTKQIFCDVMGSSLLLGFDDAEYEVELSDMKPVFEALYALKAELIAHDFKRIHRAALEAGLAPTSALARRSLGDTMLAHYLVDPEEKHDLEMLLERFGEGSGAVVGPLSIEPIYKELKRSMEDLKLTELFETIEMPVAAVLAVMEFVGVKVDPKVLQGLSKEYTAEIKELETKIYESVGHPFNLNSPKQLGAALFDKLGLPVISRTKTGYSTDAEVLTKLASKHPVPDMVLRYRELSKLKGTYIDPLPTLISPDGRVHAKFNQAVAATGRLSGSDPNLQNIPIKTPSGRKIRRAFVPESGCVFVGADYSQIELRIVAHLAGDETLISAFKHSGDVHRSTAAEIFHVKPDAVTDEQRSAAKAINFGLIYGKTAFGLSQELGISRSDAQSYIDAYFKRYKGVKAFMDACIANARKDHYSKTMYGRRRPIKDIDNKNMAVRNNAERIAMNTPVQGAAADIIKIAMIHVAKAAEEIGAHLVLSVHDELVLEVPKAKSKEAAEMLAREMQGVAKLSVPLPAESTIADNWMDL